MAGRTAVTGKPQAPAASFRVEPVPLTTEEPTHETFTQALE
ncbi:hypothetical protein ACLQ2R_33470 [Streptosporangium sp. DT93]